MCDDGPSSCMNGCPATMPAAAGCRIGCSISADHRNMDYSRSVRRPFSQGTLRQYLRDHPIFASDDTPPSLCRRWLPGLAGSPCATHTAHLSGRKGSVLGSREGERAMRRSKWTGRCVVIDLRVILLPVIRIPAPAICVQMAAPTKSVYILPSPPLTLASTSNPN
ncbi:hypothetical protein B0H13DRAFT_405701 [Mycena leptocephala]|nr:hypothetical protein B0H13DRAFT_405701 [Mycena leptocephala]